MLKSGGAVILMQQNFPNLKVIYSGCDSFEEMKQLPVKHIFDIEVCSFLDNLSHKIREDLECRNYPDIITFGFFCRKANIERLKKEYYEENRIGRGLSFHIAPSNVPINFAYTMIDGLLAGNSCIVRTSSKDFVQTNILCRIIKEVFAESDSNVKKYIAIVQYGREKEINDYFSSLSDIRVIWGGDTTIQEIRKCPIPTRCVELTFADRYSLCVLDAVAILNIKEWKITAQNFYNDTYLYDQNACSSPRLMYWLGNQADCESAQEVFWQEIHKYICTKYNIEPIIAVDKLTMDYRIAMDIENAKVNIGKDNLIHRIQITKLPDDIRKYECPGGSFLEYCSDNLNELSHIITKKFQTLSYIGDISESLNKWVIKNGFSGIDRIVPIGKTSDMTLTWDGYNLIDTMSRKIYCL